MWELDYKKAECWRIDAFELWCWRRLLRVPWTSRRSSQSIIKSWVFIGRTDVEAETPILWPHDAKSWLIGKDPVAEKDWGKEEKRTTEDEMFGWHHQLNGHGSGLTPGVGDGQGGPLLQTMSWVGCLSAFHFILLPAFYLILLSGACSSVTSFCLSYYLHVLFLLKKKTICIFIYLAGSLCFSTLEKWPFVEGILCSPTVLPLLVTQAICSRQSP